MAEETQKLYEQAVRKVRDDPRLVPHEDFILADWPEGDAHLRFVLDATVECLLDWVDAGSGEVTPS